MVNIRWTPLAADDFELTIQYYERTAPNIVKNFVKKIMYLIDNLIIFPKWVELSPN